MQPTPDRHRSSPIDTLAPRRPTSRHLLAMPRGIWALGLVSLLTDSSTEAIMALLPIFLVSRLGASALTVGWLEGVAEAVALWVRPMSGVASDWLGRRKLLALVGYGLSALGKPLFPLATSVQLVFAGRLVDRVGKGIRGAPRDALVSDLAPADARGAAYGLRQSLDSAGAIVGPLLAAGVMAASGSFRRTFWAATVPGFLAVGVLAIGVQDPRRRGTPRGHATPRWRDVGRLDRGYWRVVRVGAIVALARFSQAFLLLRSERLRLAPATIPLVLAVMNAAYALTAYPAGAWSDRIGRVSLLAAGLLVLITSNLVLTFGTGATALAIGAIGWGGHLGMTDGLLAALVADRSPRMVRGTAFGLFSIASGLSTLVASVLAGWLWSRLGPQAPFLASALIAGIALVDVCRVRESRPRES